MICTYTEYINKYLSGVKFDGEKVPGEHHFVATYLLPRVEKVMEKVADYVNPDGMKGIAGDIVYWKGGEHQFGIEVKHKTISMTKNEYNNWIVKDCKSKSTSIDNTKSTCPAMFIGVCTKGVIILPWDKFQTVYLDSINGDGKNEVGERYAKSKSINVLFEDGGGGDGYFQRGTNENEAKDNEVKFIDHLRDQLTDCKMTT